jgi:hypothetical protein
MNKKLQKIADEKYLCCVYQLFRMSAQLKTKDLASWLDITTRCVRQNRHDLRTGKLACKRFICCQNRSILFDEVANIPKEEFQLVKPVTIYTLRKHSTDKD